MRSERWIALALALIVLGSLPLRIHGWFPGGNENNDASIYILCAQSLLHGEGYSYLGEPFSVRPPGFSLLIAPILAWRGVDFLALHTLVAVLGAGAVWAFFVWLKPQVGSVVAALAALGLHFHPSWTEWSSEAMSDVPGVLAILGGLLVDRWVRAKPGLLRESALGLFLGLSALLRSTQLILLAAILLARLLERRSDGRRRCAALAAAALLAIGPWMVRDASVRSDQPALQNHVHSYATGLLREDPGDPHSSPRDWSQVLSRTVPERLQLLTAELGSLLQSEQLTFWSLLSGAAVLLALGWRAWRDREAAWLFALLYLGVLLVYFGWRSRLVLPLLPLSIAAVLVCLRSTPWRATLALALLAVGLLFSPGGQEREQLRELDQRRRTQLEAWDRVLPTAARCAALIGWHHSMGLGRPVYSLAFALRRGQKLDELLQQHRVGFILVGPEPGEQALLPQLRQRFGPGQPAGEGWVFPVDAR